MPATQGVISPRPSEDLEKPHDDLHHHDRIGRYIFSRRSQILPKTHTDKRTFHDDMRLYKNIQHYCPTSGSVYANVLASVIVVVAVIIAVCLHRHHNLSSYHTRKQPATYVVELNRRPASP